MKNLLFRIPKAAVLHGKTVGFAMQNLRFRNAKAELTFFYWNYSYKRKAAFKFFLESLEDSSFPRIYRCTRC
nr:hypothetical protein [Prevotella falsenii]